MIKICCDNCDKVIQQFQGDRYTDPRNSGVSVPLAVINADATFDVFVSIMLRRDKDPKCLSLAALCCGCETDVLRWAVEERSAELKKQND